MRNNPLSQALLACSLFILFSQAVLAGNYSEFISEEYLRSQFVFEADEKLKYSQCEEKIYETCTYVWGVESSKDATRIDLGLTPKGDKLQITYTPSKHEKNFERVITLYPDGVMVNDLGAQAVWSPQRKQLSLITADNLIIHIHIQSGSIDVKQKSISIASDLLVKL